MRYVLLFFILLTLHVKAADYSVEVGGFMPSFKGDIENPSSTVKYSDDLNYESTLISYFGFNANFDTYYIPNVSIDYFNMIDSQNAVFDSPKELVGMDFNGSVSTQTNYQVINLVLHKNFYKPGVYFDLFGDQYYTGDLYFKLGVNLKNIDYEFQIKQNDNPTSPNPYEFITVNSNVILPHFGVLYRLYDLTLFGQGSALAIGDIRANSFKVGADYRLLHYIAVSAGFLYEDFQATEIKDKVTFIASGGYMSIKVFF
ncbi:MAG: hypothetical protein U9N52_10695 [Campylobacterota bacterium]|nr:hypothetical protein [Campylobacterota bacterium]